MDVLDPAATTIIPTDGPIREVQPVIEQDVLLLMTPWTITALGPNGTCWVSRRLAIEGLRIDSIVDGYLLGVADPDDDEPRDFTIDLETGAATGGAGHLS